MVPGFNHNIKHKGKIYHIQTEDSGVGTPHIITLLYIGGTILARKKTSYADILKVNDLNFVVRELMEEQHKSMLKQLISGAFDDPDKTPPPPESPAPAQDKEKPDFGDDVISDKGLDEVILNFLSSEIKE